MKKRKYTVPIKKGTRMQPMQTNPESRSTILRIHCGRVGDWRRRRGGLQTHCKSVNLKFMTSNFKESVKISIKNPGLGVSHQCQPEITVADIIFHQCPLF